MNAPLSVVIALGSYNSSLLTRISSWAKKSSPVEVLALKEMKASSQSIGEEKTQRKIRKESSLRIRITVKHIHKLLILGFSSFPSPLVGSNTRSRIESFRISAAFLRISRVS
ncbi:hypothetical protein Pfo_011466 [Paulownia fortunei]|nr:hypothetical protein Pfo_011466 [Paulownia fortunei]